MTTDPSSSGSFRRLSPEHIRSQTTKARATRTQRAIEITLFATFALTVVVSGIALYAMNSRSYKALPNRFAEGLSSGRVNVLFIGLATTPANNDVTVNAITLLSLKPDLRQAAMISVPADLWVRVGRFGVQRLGRADALGVSAGYPGEGTGLVSDAVSSITGEPVHAVIRMDEDGLAQLVDAVGGVQVNVTHRFYEWRVRKRFGTGIRNLNGERATWFISPYVGGAQGKPAARELRQQQLLLAVLTKLQSASPEVRKQFATMHRTRQGRVTADTNLTPREVDDLLAMLRGTSAVRHVTMTHLLEPFQVRAIHDKGEALRPRGNDYAQLRTVVRDAFDEQRTAVLTPTIASAAQTVLVAAPEKSK